MNSKRRLDGVHTGVADAPSISARPPDLVLRYGDDSDHVADVHVPPAAITASDRTGGRALLTIFIHGGFWRAQYGREHTAPLAAALAASGFVVCAPEYRRIGQLGGGWPGTFDDVAAAVDRLPGLVAEATGGLVAADAGGVILAGHSAGGHLALWAASRHMLPSGSPWYKDRPGWRGVVALAAVSDLVGAQRRALSQQAVGTLMGGGPAEVADDRYWQADPARLLPAGGPVWLLHGMADDQVPYLMSLDYARWARAAGARAAAATCVLLPGAGHFEVVDPLSREWPQVVEAFWRVGS